MNRAIQLIQPDISHVGLLAEIGAKTFAETFVGMQYYTQKIVDGYTSQAFAHAVVQSELTDSLNHFRLLRVEDEWAGYAKLIEGNSPAVLAGRHAINLQRIYILKAFQRRGLGDVLLNESFAIGRQLGYQHLWLTVWEFNKPALTFYRKHGFTQEGDYEWAFEHEGKRYVDIDWVFTKPL